MPQPRSLMLLQCVAAPNDTDVGGWWLGECFLTSDGPRMRMIPGPARATEEEARAELDRRNAIVAPPRKD